MDRIQSLACGIEEFEKLDLNSNMDRIQFLLSSNLESESSYLNSNMDRIQSHTYGYYQDRAASFKFQYG